MLLNNFLFPEHIIQSVLFPSLQVKQSPKHAGHGPNGSAGLTQVLSGHLQFGNPILLDLHDVQSEGNGPEQPSQASLHGSQAANPYL